MMIGVGFIFMVLLLLVFIGTPLLIIALPARKRSLSSRSGQNPPTNSHLAPVESIYASQYPTCGRGVKADWNVCPSCGSAPN